MPVITQVPVTLMAAMRRTVDAARLKAGVVVHRVRGIADGGSQSVQTTLGHSIVSVERAAGKRVAARAFREAKQSVLKGLRPPTLTVLPSQAQQVSLDNNPLFRRAEPAATAVSKAATASFSPSRKASQWLHDRHAKAKARLGHVEAFVGRQPASGTSQAAEPACRRLSLQQSYAVLQRYAAVHGAALSSLLNRGRASAAVLRPTVALRPMSTVTTFASTVTPRRSVARTVPRAARPPVPPVAQYRTQPLHTSSWDSWAVAPTERRRSSPPAPRSTPVGHSAASIVPPVRRMHIGRAHAAGCTAEAGPPASVSRARAAPAAAAEGYIGGVGDTTDTPSPRLSSRSASASRTAAAHGGCAPFVGQARRFTLRGNTEGASADTGFVPFVAPRIPMQGAAPRPEARRPSATVVQRRNLHTGVTASKTASSLRTLHRALPAATEC